ncbi:acyl-CoA dehydrogenase family protein [Marinobacter sp. X15-166B]|uniref:acyl-CoA dehydrogenase family protein n=1 Tax=Marinobacter sp. X15-166B TaxID=1897620 RepID=UPI00085C4EBF|nr:acyl-CoA dehydrogenase family protein [Marinobacter sp. X15-166B]OEY66305.1 acyl-CoA dehydrogenase [Marinobacter sp. X15-166B]
MSNIEQFRHEVRAWLETNCPQSMRGLMPADEMVWGGRDIEFQTEDQRLWFERMRDKGWFCPDWPVEYGGGGLSAEQTSVLEAEMRRLRCRPPQINLGIWMLGPVLLEFGTEAQKRELLPPMARGEVRWCQGFSEPNAGSDLASLQTSARSDGDDFVVNGTKIWTSYGDKSDWMYALVRTGPKEPKHAGISLIVLDMHSPGVTVTPIDLISGKSSFCQVFFDDVRVPKAQLIGEINEGWALAKALLGHERRAMSKFSEISLPTHFDLLETLFTYLPEPATPSEMALHQRAINCRMEEHAFELTQRRLNEAGRARQDISGLMAIQKLVHTEQEKDKFEVLLDVMGHRALGWEGDGFSERELALTHTWLNSFTQSIAGGTSEVQLNVIAKRVLGLPEAK